MLTFFTHTISAQRGAAFFDKPDRIATGMCVYAMEEMLH